jgi:putative endonuclease
LYIGVTNDLSRRITEHKLGLIPGFTKRYGVHMLVHFEEYGDHAEAIAREKSLKRWRRDWKRSLIEESNPRRADLSAKIAPGLTVGPGSPSGRPG